jgi:sorbitol-specific phosphotransferase system component IIA
MSMNWFVGDAVTHGGIVGASWNYNSYDYGSGWYYVAVGPNTWLNVQAAGHVGAWFNTDTYDPNNAGAIYLARQPPPNGGTKKR